ncbi:MULTISPECIES: multidrug efflux RND transporter permease subunit CmeB, ciprofloxacin and florfenicol resistance type [Campylobacter]|uniref:multidrug efflux RND transporter permease subunit CmeB, ciprofloxacin and florfenicol resistance type n=1 Tax=Campylobacter TaxID=194 RepID=UPI0012CDF1D3|nr:MULTISPECIES: multidrug efflux RND transporter permease subunit [Campylobacter]EAK0311996.1 efflux RND transporter permease subunit [Campylobacter coli]MCC2571420.1 efflux RND transporter permease subunit [Campylobacter coli]MCC2582882.1 efflux RND transporter permease subunit [Campylobacter coli]MCC3020140.1 efflux RND transporter permease subunit [Campylobacter jejuni]MCC3023379.1 efflux RND transporter permease subunit [Campylobacter jejuni]
MFSKFFIERPIFASVVAIIISIAGIIGLANLPVEQYPSLTPPTVQVSATYTGADAQTIASTVATPIEDAINGVDNMIYMDSTSSPGQMKLTVYFNIGTDPDQAAIDVNNRISAATAKLPEAVKKLGVTVRKSSSTILEVVSVYSEDSSMNDIDIYNYVSLNILDELKRIPGVGDASAIGNKNYSMRIWLEPDLLNKFGVTANDVINAVNDQNAQYATGKIGEEPVVNKSPQVISITMQGRLQTPQEFENIILRVNEDKSFLRIKDVAKVEIGAEQYNSTGRLNTSAAVPIMINLQSGANAVNTAKLINEKMQELSKNFPQGLKYQIPYDTTIFVKASIKEVIKTFVEALALVLVVMYLFLKNFKSTIIPMIAVPVSLLGTFAGLYVLGFSINLLTLFALVLAIGIVVDDAIIVVENIDRILHEDSNISVKDAAIKAMNEVSSPVISIVLVLCAVFIPVSFISGFVGEIQRQFALTLAISVAISGFVALTLTPSLSALFLTRNESKPFYFIQKFNDFFDWSTSVFSSGVAYILKRTIRFVLVFCIMIGFIAYLFKIVPSSLVPSEDQGFIMSIINLPSGSSIHRTIEEVDTINKNATQMKEISSSVSLIGFDLFTSSLKENAAAVFFKLKDWSQREASSDQIIAQLFGQYAADRNALSYFLNLPPIPGLSLTGGFEMYAQNKSGKDYDAIQQDVNKMLELARTRKELANVRTTLDTSFPQYKLIIDRDKMKYYNLNMQDVFNTISATIGTYYVNDFPMLGKNFQVNIRALGDFRNTQDALKNIYIRSSDNKMIPLNSFLTLVRSAGPDDVERFNLFPAALIQGDPAPGYTSGQAIDAIAEVAKQSLGDEYSIAWSGSAYQEVSSKGAGAYAFVLGMIFVFLILAAQYERWLMPLAVITAVPFAVFGSILLVALRGFDNDIYFQTGLLLLIGLSAKNAILIVEFAMEERFKKGKGVFEAAVAAAKLRFRPIIMTSLAFTFGVLPMIFATGAGSASRHSLGTGLIGGMIAASTLAIFFVPLFFYLLENFNEWLDKKRGKIHE